jgi:hypothetical protein
MRSVAQLKPQRKMSRIGFIGPDAYSTMCDRFAKRKQPQSPRLQLPPRWTRFARNSRQGVHELARRFGLWRRDTRGSWPLGSPMGSRGPSSSMATG